MIKLPKPQELHDLVLTVYDNKKPFYKYEAIINYIAELNKEPENCNCGSKYIVNMYDICPDCNKKRIVYE